MRRMRSGTPVPDAEPRKRRHRARFCLILVVALAGALTLKDADARADMADFSVAVPGTSNIFGAGIAAPPQPGGGGAGTLPVLVELPTGTGRVLTLTGASGLINCCSNLPDTSPPGGASSSGINPYGGLSGFRDDHSIPLVGVFLTDAPPGGEGPPTVDWSTHHEDTVISPEIAQVFYLGNGRTAAGGEVQSFRVPDGATRLYLGTADAAGFSGSTGYYDDNTGQWQIQGAVTGGSPCAGRAQVVQICSVSPAHGPWPGGTSLTVTGAGFAPGDELCFYTGTFALAVEESCRTSTRVLSSTELSAVAPALPSPSVAGRRILAIRRFVGLDARSYFSPVTYTYDASCPQRPASPPRDVVILITGLTSSLPTWGNRDQLAYDPLAVSYCGLTGVSTQDPSDLAYVAEMAQHTFDSNNDGPIAPIDLTDSLASTGAVLLPFSYTGVSLTGTASDPVYRVHAFGSDVPGTALPQDEAGGLLLGLIRQINQIWPSARIEVIGHSEGGFVAEQLFENQPPSRLHNVIRIFSLDSPINGIASATPDWVRAVCSVASGLESRSSCLKIISPALLSEYAQRWRDKESIDRRLIERDRAENQLYVPLGTSHDWLYTIADVSWIGPFATGACQGLDTQVLWNDFSFSCYLEDIENQGDRRPSELSWVTSDPDEHGTPARPGFALNSHSFVMQAASNITFITQFGPAAAGPAAAARAHATVADAHASTAAGLFHQTLTAAPFAVLARSLAHRGRPFAIRGADLGAVAGRVLFRGRHGTVAAKVVAWSPKRVRVIVPPRAVSGPISLITADRDEVIPGLAVVLRPANRVRRLAVVGRPRGRAGKRLKLRVRALGRHGRHVAGAAITLVGPGPARRRRTNRRGVATFRLSGFGRERLVAVSGNASATVTAHWSAAAADRLTVSAHRRHARRRSTRADWVVTAVLRSAHGRPVRRRLVHFQLLGLSQARLGRARVRTSRAGKARTKASLRDPGTAVVEARAEQGALADGVILTGG